MNISTLANSQFNGRSTVINAYEIGCRHTSCPIVNRRWFRRLEAQCALLIPVLDMWRNFSSKYIPWAYRLFYFAVPSDFSRPNRYARDTRVHNYGVLFSPQIALGNADDTCRISHQLLETVSGATPEYPTHKTCSPNFFPQWRKFADV
jgi:hypothetical protein